MVGNRNAMRTGMEAQALTGICHSNRRLHVIAESVDLHDDTRRGGLEPDRGVPDLHCRGGIWVGAEDQVHDETEREHDDAGDRPPTRAFIHGGWTVTYRRICRPIVHRHST